VVLSAFTEHYLDTIMKQPESALGLEKQDYLVALVLAGLALAAYVRTLAPDVLYADSAEFQCLAYTLGITHSTGYPTYLFLGRLIGFLPIHNPAWRISLLSAICAATTVGGVYLLARDFTRSQVGPVLGSVALAISYTFWSQAVIAEVYVPGMAFLVMIMLFLSRWQTNPGKRNLSLLMAALVAGIGFGVHASVWLVAPPAIAFVLWTLWWQRASIAEWLRSLSAGFIGALVGLVIFLTTFFISDRLNSPTSFIRTTLEPSRVFWNLQSEDFDSPFKHLKMTVVSAQWGDALFPDDEDFSFKKELEKFNERLTGIELPPLVLLFSLVGFVVMLFTHPLWGAFFPLTFIVSLFFILNYQVGDKYVFYLSLYIPLVVAAGTGMGFVLQWIHHYLERVPDRGQQFLNLLPVMFLITMVVQPVAAIRWKALRAGVADFVTEDYPYPVRNLKEPRLVAQMRLAGVEANAVFVLDWRALYTTAYLAHVEKGMTDTLFFEAMPRGHNGKVASTLIAELRGYLQEGRPVYVEQKYPGLEEHFRLLPVAGDSYELSLRN
jgi:hypothetical protein